MLWDGDRMHHRVCKWDAGARLTTGDNCVPVVTCGGGRLVAQRRLRVGRRVAAHVSPLTALANNIMHGISYVPQSKMRDSTSDPGFVAASAPNWAGPPFAP